MRVIVEDLARENILEIFTYNSRYSIRNAIEINTNILAYINELREFPFIGRYIPELQDQHFREIIYRKGQHSGYRIMYYISENDVIYVFNVMSTKQDFNSFLKLYNYFKNYFKF